LGFEEWQISAIFRDFKKINGCFLRFKKNKKKLGEVLVVF
jgi:hypothetical protein